MKEECERLAQQIVNICQEISEVTMGVSTLAEATSTALPEDEDALKQVRWALARLYLRTQDLKQEIERLEGFEKTLASPVFCSTDDEILVQEFEKLRELIDAIDIF